MAAPTLNAAEPHTPHGTLRVAVGQLFLPVGDLSGNRARITECMQWAEESQADLLVLPELAITGYPPEDLLHAPGFVEANLAVLEDLAACAGNCVTVVGFVDSVPAQASSDSAPRRLANAVALLYAGQVRGRVHKVLLPNYGVFDERRYFAAGHQVSGTWALHGAEVGVLVCEDIWRPDLADAIAADGGQLLASANASPFHRGKSDQRTEVVIDTARRCGMPVAYANLVGGQDEVVFDGGSLVVDGHGAVIAEAPQFEEARVIVDVPLVHPPTSRRSRFVCRPAGTSKRELLPEPPLTAPTSDVEQVYRALVRSLADFAEGHGYRLAVLGLSGGIDSAVTTALLTDALGPDRVWAVTLQGPATRTVDVEDAVEQGQRLGIRHDCLDVRELFQAQASLVAGLLGASANDLGEAGEGILPRLRAVLLLAVGIHERGMVVTPANKTELAVGYGHLYGDLAGTFAPLADVPKTLLWELARWRNGVDGDEYGWAVGREPIPDRVVTKEPSARRTPDRPDRELPATYAIIDAVLERLVELAQSPDEVVDAGFDPDVVQRIADLVEANEGTRQQAPPGPKITAKAFGRERRQPLTHHWRPRLTPPGAERPGTEHVPDPDALLEG
jgi:NAD+ synthase (glutamine-hydrolysing)